MSTLPNKFISGNDLLPSFLIRDCWFVLLSPLLLVNLSIKTALFRFCWKPARICPVFKKSDSSLIPKYGPTYFYFIYFCEGLRKMVLSITTLRHFYYWIHMALYTVDLQLWLHSLNMLVRFSTEEDRLMLFILIIHDHLTL